MKQTQSKLFKPTCCTYCGIMIQDQPLTKADKPYCGELCAWSHAQDQNVSKDRKRK